MHLMFSQRECLYRAAHVVQAYADVLQRLVDGFVAHHLRDRGHLHAGTVHRASECPPQRVVKEPHADLFAERAVFGKMELGGTYPLN